MSGHIAEVIEASTGEFVAQSYEVNQPPPFGSLVRTADGDADLYGIVYQVTTAGLDPGRRAVALGRGEDDPEAIYRTHPQLHQLFRTDFHALVVGYRAGGRITHTVPQRPARVHGFVYPCADQEVRQFSDALDFLPLLLAAQPAAPLEELLAAFLRRAAAARPDGRDFLVRAGKALALLVRGDVRRLSVILERIRP
ncbi:MAG: hypothetical protein HY689_14900 [Chloroflexi bacterium]|nr:hypothetical protein [Chloroflexota bacterium]